jgi:ureidoglycolate dehydrogenase (NAD+)
MKPSGAHVDWRELESYVAELLVRTGFSSTAGRTLAKGFVEADLRGRSSHGVLHVPNLIKRAELGLVSTRARPRRMRETVATVRLDGRNGPGIVVATVAMDVAIEKAAAVGVGVVAVTNSTHFGLGALHAERATMSGMIGIAVSNATPILPAPGGSRRIVGTNPIAIAAPGGDDEPLISVDMGLSQITMGFVRDCLQRGVRLPPGVAARSDGQMTTDPQEALEGLLLPAGGHKGYALAIAVEVLAGVLSGSGIGPEVGSLFFDYDRPQRTGHLLIAISPAHFLSRLTFNRRMKRLAAWVNGPAVAGGRNLPGQRSNREADARRSAGVPLERETADALKGIGERLGVEWPLGWI